MPGTAVYCPGLDTEMQTPLDQMVFYKWVEKNDVHVGGGRSLANVDSSAKLYVLCHGHGQLPLFSTNAGKWSAVDLATLMLNDGLKTSHRELELLVCHAGESLTSTKAAEQRMALYHQYKNAAAIANKVQMNKISAKFDAVASQGPGPALFSHESQILPLCAQLVQALKDLGFGFIRVRGYKASVCMYCSEGPGVVLLDLRKSGGIWGERATPEYTVDWL
jgi:hypothetical protein